MKEGTQVCKCRLVSLVCANDKTDSIVALARWAKDLFKDANISLVVYSMQLNTVIVLL